MKDFLMYLLASLLTIPFTVLVLHISGWYKKYITMKVQDRIGWWLLSPSKEILYYIQNRCVVEYIGTEYLIQSESECEIAFEIIKAFQADSKWLYLECHRFANGRLARKAHSEFFMYYFETYLDKHNDYYFNGNKMYVEKTKENNCVKCSITEYGIVYKKLFYMARLFCEKSSTLNKNNDYWSEGIKQSLDTKETAFYHHSL